MRLRCLALCSLLLSSSTAVWAQEPAPAGVPSSEIAQLSPEPRSVTEWPVSRAPHWQKVDIVLVAEPGARHACRVKTITDAEILCKRRLHAATHYLRSDVAAIVLPAHRDAEILPVALFLSFQGGVGYGLYLLAGLSLGAAVPLAVLVGFFTFAMLSWSVSDIVPDRLIYASSGAPLSVKLH